MTGHITINVESGARVLDVGCGSDPHPLATHVTEWFIDDNRHRFGNTVARDDRPLTICSVTSMPFDANEFDFVHCRHVLEHVEDPAAACRELSRVGRRGYIECPASWLEVVAPSPEHRWLVDCECSELWFREKVPVEQIGAFGIAKTILMMSRDPGFQAYWNSPQILKVRNVSYFWHDEIRFRVIREDQRGNR